MVRSVVSSMLGLSLVATPIATHKRPLAPPILHGTITSAEGQGIESAQVLVDKLSIGTQTAANGRWSLRVPDSLRGRDINLKIRRIGYQPVDHAVRVTGDSVRVDVQLAPAALSLEQVVVTGTASVIERRALGASVAVVEDGRARKERRDEGPNTEGYSRISENTFRSARDVPLSTFSIDVDRASYSNMRRFITSGQQPPADAVRLEELVNYFPYDYATPTTEQEPVRVTTDVAMAPWAPAHRLVRVGLRARDVDLSALPAGNLVFLIDVSGSMNVPNKLPLVKDAMLLLVDQLREQDRVAIVVYAGAAGLVLPSTSGAHRNEIRAAIERLSAGGSTAGGAGIRLAYQVAKENFITGGNNRVILATDGDFNVGASSNAEMERLIEEKRAEGTFLTVLGFGMGNYKDDKLETLADKGNGNYAYIDSQLEARKVFVHELGGTLLTVAKDVKVQVEFNPARVASYRLLGYENRLLNDEDFTDDVKDAGEMGAGHSVTALYEVVPVGAERDPSRTTGRLRYQGDRVTRSTALGDELLHVKVRYKERDGSRSRELKVVTLDRPVTLAGDFAFASAVAEFAMVVRGSKDRGEAAIENVIARAEGALGTDPHGYRREFLSLARRYADITPRVAERP